MISSHNIVGAVTQDLHGCYLKVKHEVTSWRNQKGWKNFEWVTCIELSTFAKMSGPIRCLLGLTKAHLQGYIKQARTLFMNESDLDKEETQLEDLIQQLSTNIVLLERCSKKWTTLLTELPKGEEKLAGEKEYLWAADSDDGLIELLLDSNETVARLQGRLAQVLRKQEKGLRPLLPNTTETLEQRNKVTSQIKLPKMNLPVFDGNILCWQEFWFLCT